MVNMFLRIWLFGVYIASLESFFLDRADPIWFTFLVAVVGLHYLSRFRTTTKCAASDVGTRACGSRKFPAQTGIFGFNASHHPSQ